VAHFATSVSPDHTVHPADNSVRTRNRIPGGCGETYRTHCEATFYAAVAGMGGSGIPIGIELAEMKWARKVKKDATDIRATPIRSVQFNNLLNSPQALEGG
jgi:hypothetical protein